MTINFDLALEQLGEDWLTTSDRAAESIAANFLRHRQPREAMECLAAHLERTEVTRRRMFGPGPDPAVVVEEFIACLMRQVGLHQALTGSVNVTRPPSHSSGDAGAKGTHEAAPTFAAGVAVERHNAPASCAPGDLSRVPPLPTCGHVAANGMVCVQPPEHPPGEHYCVRGTG